MVHTVNIFLIRKEKKDNLVWEWCPKAEFIYVEKMWFGFVS